MQAFQRFNVVMTRCMSCDGILAKNETACYSCGEPVPGRFRSGKKGLSLLLPLALIATIAVAAYSFFLGQ